MNKTLNSGIVVDSDQHYKLLEWKDENMQKFIFWCQSKWTSSENIKYSINTFTEGQYNELLKFAGIN